ncbi:rcorf133 [Ochrobactrum sp. CDB2]|uniref:Transposase domain protein n=1 Tax=Brucella pseudogrignonensis TaxID=419475 RepID=A0A256GB23_9HYPH|nr:rcorf133 [Ochrobactrum sp. CDB2]OYR24140.1 transposase domain protein [Brucella pseudogrignonensis]
MACVKEGGTLLADKAYDTDAIRKTAADLKIWANIPPKSSRKDVSAFSPWVYLLIAAEK